MVNSIENSIKTGGDEAMENVTVPIADQKNSTESLEGRVNADVMTEGSWEAEAKEDQKFEEKTGEQRGLIYH